MSTRALLALVFLFLPAGSHAQAPAFLVGDLNQQTSPATAFDSAFSNPGLTNVGEITYFVARTFELWKSDGTAEGTVRVKDVFPGTAGGASCPCAAAGDLFFFIGFEYGTVDSVTPVARIRVSYT